MAHEVSARVKHLELSVVQAATTVVSGCLSKGDGGVICVGKDGEIAMVFNTGGMYREAANATGRFDVAS